MDIKSFKAPAKNDYDRIINNSEIIMHNYEKLMIYLNNLPADYQKIIRRILKDPFPDFEVQPLTSEIENLMERGYKTENRDTLFKTAPGAFSNSHNNFPGGLVLHTLTNIETAISTVKSFENLYPGILIKKDQIIAALFMHDLMKSWIMTWKEDFSSYPDINIERHKFHHLLIIAKSIKENMESNFIKTLASVHYHPVNDKAGLADSIKLSEKLTGADKTDYDEELLLEQWICYSAEHQSRDLLLYCGKTVYMEITEAVKRLYGNDIDSSFSNCIKNIILTLKSDIELYQYIITNGRKAFDCMIKTLLKDHLLY